VEGKPLSNDYVTEGNRVRQRVGACDHIRVQRKHELEMGDFSAGSHKVVVGVFNYQARESSDVSFAKGDRMLVLDESLVRK